MMRVDKNNKTVNIINILLIIFIGFIGFFSLSIYINKFCQNTIYMDKIRLLADNLDKIMSNSMTIQDFFSVHSGHFSIGTYLILIFEVKILDLNNGIVLIKIIPFFLLFIYLLISFWHLKIENSSICKIVYNMIFSILLCFSLFSLLQVEIIRFSYGSIIFLSNFLFILSIVFACISYKNGNYYLIIFSTIIGLLACILFGSGYDYAFIVSVELINAFIIFKYFKSNKKVFVFSFVSFILYLILFIFLGYLLLTSESSTGHSINIFEMIKFYFYSIASIFIDTGESSSKVTLTLGIIIFILCIIAVLLFFVKKLYKQSLLPLILIVFSQMVLVCVLFSRNTYGTTYGMASRYYASYIYLLIGIFDIFIYFLFTEKKKYILCIYEFFTFLLFLLCISYNILFISKEMDVAPYRVEIGNHMMTDMYFYETIPDNELSSLYQASPEKIKECIELLKKYNLYVFDPDNSYTMHMTDSIITTNTSYGTYGTSDGNKFIKKYSAYFVKSYEDKTININFFNPGNFKTNKITIIVDGVLIYDEVIIESDSRISLPVTIKSGVTKITISLEFDTNLKEQGLGEDTRDLGLLIYS